MKTANEWAHELQDADIQRPWRRIITPEQIEAIQQEAIEHAAWLVNDLSRGTHSEERAIAIDEARDAILEDARLRWPNGYKLSDDSGPKPV